MNHSNKNIKFIRIHSIEPKIKSIHSTNNTTILSISNNNKNKFINKSKSMNNVLTKIVKTKILLPNSKISFRRLDFQRYNSTFIKDNKFNNGINKRSNIKNQFKLRHSESLPIKAYMSTKDNNNSNNNNKKNVISNASSNNNNNKYNSTSSDTYSGTFWEKPDSLHSLFEYNKKWREEKNEKDPTYFEKTSVRQLPSYLWIGCSDSRVPTEEISGLSPGEVFVHRNIANLVVNNDISAMSIVQFAVENLKVKDIIVCGHYGCGGCKAATMNQDFGLLDNWLRNIRDVCRLYHDELEAIRDERQRSDRLVELNVVEQCINLFKIGLVQRHQVKYGYPRIHGLVYDMTKGELKELKIDFRSYIRKYRSIYKLHSFPTDVPLRRGQLQANMIRALASGHEEENNIISEKFLKRKMINEPDLFSEREIENAFEKIKKSPNGTICIQDIADFFERR